MVEGAIWGRFLYRTDASWPGRRRPGKSDPNRLSPQTSSKTSRDQQYLLRKERRCACTRHFTVYQRRREISNAQRHGAWLPLRATEQRILFQIRRGDESSVRGSARGDPEY